MEGRNGMDKSAAKKDYKEAKRPMGVYRIRNTRNRKSYVGFDRDWVARINRHKAELKFGSHRNRELQEEWNALGEASFQFEVLDELDHKETSQTSPIEELRVLAEMWIRKLEKAGDSVVSLQPAAAPKTSST
jgi:GIY-YIG catalytic domain